LLRVFLILSLALRENEFNKASSLSELKLKSTVHSNRFDCKSNNNDNDKYTITEGKKLNKYRLKLSDNDESDEHSVVIVIFANTNA
jgi:hypothetical protein